MTTSSAKPTRVYPLFQRDRLMPKEPEEELWISGEDLHTACSSSDEEKVSKSSSMSRASASKQLRRKSLKAEAQKSLLEEQTDFMASEKEGHCQLRVPELKTKALGRPSGLPLPRTSSCYAPRRKSVKEIDEFAGPSTRSSRSMSLTESLDLEHNWRPKRGSLKLPALLDECGDGDDGRGLFYKEMACNINELKDLPELESRLPLVEKVSSQEAENKKKEIRRLKEAIRKMEEETARNIAILNAETKQRMENRLTSAKLGDDRVCDTDPALLLDMLNLQETSTYASGEGADPGLEKSQQESHLVAQDGVKNFLKRNVKLAARAMSSFPMTDDEKEQLQELLMDMDCEEQVRGDDKEMGENADGNAECKILVEGGEEEEEEEKEGKATVSENAYHLSGDDQKRISEIDVELDKFEKFESTCRSPHPDKDDFWRNLILDQALKDVDAKLDALHESEIEPQKPHLAHVVDSTENVSA